MRKYSLLATTVMVLSLAGAVHAQTTRPTAGEGGPVRNTAGEGGTVRTTAGEGGPTSTVGSIAASPVTR